MFTGVSLVMIGLRDEASDKPELVAGPSEVAAPMEGALVGDNVDGDSGSGVVTESAAGALVSSIVVSAMVVSPSSKTSILDFSCSSNSICGMDWNKKAKL